MPSQHTGDKAGAGLRIHRLQIPKAKLKAIPDAERGLFFMLAHIANELMGLSRLLQFAINHDAAPAIVVRAQSSQSMLIAKVFAGKANEAWEAIRKVFFESKLGKTYEPLLEKEGLAALEKLKKYFNKKSLLSFLRNEFAFHYPSDEWRAKLDAAFAVLDEEECEFYVADIYLNTLWYGAEAVLNHALIERIDSGKPEQALGRMMDETIEVAGWLCEFCDFTIGAILLRHIGMNPLGDAEEIEIVGVPDRDDVRLPVFVRAMANKSWNSDATD